MTKNKNHLSYLAEKMSDVKIGQRLVIGMMLIITVMVIPIILLISSAIQYQHLYNRALENLSDISFIIQETESQGYRIIDYCIMKKEISKTDETKNITTMMKCIDRIHDNIGDKKQYQKNQDVLTIVDNLLMNYANSYKTGTQKCGKYFNLSGDSDFYSMVDTGNYIIQNCHDLLSLEMNRSNDLKNKISANFKRIILVISLFVIVVILMMISLVYTMSESITYPLGKLMNHIAAISKSGLIDQANKQLVDMDDNAAREEHK